MASTNPIYEDITQLCRDAAAELNDSKPMVASDNFSLYESMSAVEILDPKMDPCYGLKHANLDDTIVSNIGESLSPSFVISLIRRLVINEVAFLDGASMVESINQCVYVWPQAWDILTKRNDPSADIIVRYAKHLMESASKVHRGVLDADIYEDEDFQNSSTFTTSSMDDDAVSENTQALISLVNGGSLSDELRALLQCRVGLNNTMSAINTAIDNSLRAARESTPETPAAGLSNIANIISFVTPLLNTLDTLKGFAKEDNETAGDAADLEKAFQRDILRITQTSPARQFPMKSYADSIEYLIATCRAIVTVCEGVKSLLYSTAELDLDTLYGFLSQISRRTYSVVPRSLLWGIFHLFKPSLAGSIISSMKHWQIPMALLESEMAHQWSLMLAINVWDFLKVLTVSRCRHTSRLEHMAERIGVIVQDAHSMDEHVRRTIHKDVPEGEDAPAQQWYMSWAVYVVTSYMDEYLSALIEMDIVASYEMDVFYWYWDYVMSCRLWSIKTVRQLKYSIDIALHETMQLQAQEVMKDTKKKKKGKGNSASSSSKKSCLTLKEAKRVIGQPPPPTPMASYEEYIITIKSQIAKGLVRVYLSHRVSGLMQQPDTPNCSIQNLFLCRYRMFQFLLNPPALEYANYTNAVQQIPEYSPYFNAMANALEGEGVEGHGLSQDELKKISIDLLTAAGRAFKSVKDLTERATTAYQVAIVEGDITAAESKGLYLAGDVKRRMLKEDSADFMKISVTLSINCLRRTKDLENSTAAMGRARLQLDKTHSKYFPVPAVVERSQVTDSA